MENNTAMLGGESAISYSRNSKFQKQAADAAKSPLVRSILDSFDLANDSRVVIIADLGCSTGPNTFSTVNTMIEAVKIKCENMAPEFHVFFNDQVSNDFNTLFRALPEDRGYYAAGVPGSFHGRLFPESSINLMNSTMALHWLTKLPHSLSNPGKLTYVRSSESVVDTYKAQFYGDVRVFLEARSQELVPGGLLTFHIPSRPEGTSPAEAVQLHFIECLGDILNHMVKEGIVMGELVDSFNMPWFIPTPSEIMGIVGSSGTHLMVERAQEMKHESRLDPQEDVQALTAHLRAATKTLLSQHFGEEVVDELFVRFPGKLRDFMLSSPVFLTAQETRHTTLFVVLKRSSANNKIEEES